MAIIKQRLFLLITSIFLSITSYAQPDTVYLAAYLNHISRLDINEPDIIVEYWLYGLTKSPKNFFDEIEFQNVNEVEIINQRSVKKFKNSHHPHYKYFHSALVRAEISQSWNVTRFPYDKQSITFEIKDANFGNELVFIPEKFLGDPLAEIITLDFNKELEQKLPGWKIKQFGYIDYSDIAPASDTSYLHTTHNFENYISKVELTAESELFHFGKEELHEIGFKVDLARNDAYFPFKVLMGMWISFLIGIMMFLLPSSALDAKIGIGLAGVFGAIGNKYIIDDMIHAPVTTIADVWHDLTFGVLLLIITAGCHIHVTHLKYEKSNMNDTLMNMKMNKLRSNWLLINIFVYLVGSAIIFYWQ